jgi:hypothetical protein
VVLMLSGVSPRFSSMIARSPSASRFTHTSALPCSDSRVASAPSGSWSMAMTARLVRMSRTAGVIDRRSLPASSGADIDHMLNCAWSSDVVSPLRPIWRMSGSFQWPGPA